MKKTVFTVDFLEMTITGSKASFNKAGKGKGEEYKELTRLMKAHPDFVLVKKEQESHITRAKRTYHGLDYKFMKLYIKYTQEDSEKVMKEFKAIEELAKAEKASVYPLIKRWFIDKFGETDFETDTWFFDMKKARKDMAKAIVIKAKENAISKAEEKAIMEIISEEEKAVA